MRPEIFAEPKKGVALAIMAKLPAAGACKTRLVPPLNYEEAAALSERFLRDTAENVVTVARKMGASAVGACTPEPDATTFAKLFGAGVTCVPQRGGDFGARLYNVACDLFAAGHRGVCLIDSDSPTLPSAFLCDAIRALEARGDRAVLGPAIDGGYYLIGMKRPHLALFSGIAWSTNAVFEQTQEAAKRISLQTTVLPSWYDVDDETGLQMLSRELLGPNLTQGFDAVRTREFLNSVPHATANVAKDAI